MTILGIGVDLVHVPRITALLRRCKPQRFATRILSQREWSDWELLPNHPNFAQFLAVRWSVKEAFYKAAYPTIKASWKDLSYCSRKEDGSKPALIYHPANEANRVKVGIVHVSVSHDGDYVYTSVLLEGP